MYGLQRLGVGCFKTPAIGKHEEEVFPIVCLLVKSSLVVMFPRHVCALQADNWLVCSQSVSFGMWSGQVHELWERHHSDWAHSWQVSPGTNIRQITTRRNNNICTIHSYWSICPVHQSSEQHDKYSLGSLYSPELLVYLSSTPVV